MGRIEPGGSSRRAKGHTVPRILVLLATYNGAPWLRQQIDSILAQAEVEVDILVGDDASDDTTVELLSEGWPNDARVQLRVADRSSGSAGANFRRLFREVKCDSYDFIALADQDDIWHPDKLSRAVTALGDGHAGGYSAAVRAFWPDGGCKVLRQCARERTADFMFEGAGQGCTFVLTNTLFSRIQRFCIDHEEATEALHYHDWLIYLLARAWSVPWHFDPAPSIDYRQHEGNEIGSRGSVAAVSRRLKNIRNGWYGRQIASAVRLYATVRPDDPFIASLSRMVSSRDSIVRRMKLAAFVARHGRRRLSDRAVLACAAMLGWI